MLFFRKKITTIIQRGHGDFAFAPESAFSKAKFQLTNIPDTVPQPIF